VTNLPWKIYIDPARRLAGFENESYYHPLFAYESILNFANVLLLVWLTRRYQGSLKRGDVFNVYLIFYPAVRFGLDFLRLDASEVLSLNINQTVMAVVCVVAIGVLIWRHRSASPDGKAPAAPREIVRRASAAKKKTTPVAGRARRVLAKGVAKRPVARRKTARRA
jgi:prolipoprotein diacylglyceryltransferase